MASVKINCPKCGGYGLTGTTSESVCSQCKGVGTITVLDSDTLAAINTASEQPMVVTVSKPIPAVAIKAATKGSKS